MEIGDTTALGEMLGIAMREDVGIVAGTVYDDRDRLYCAGLEFAGAYESPVQKWQAETERAIDLKEIKIYTAIRIADYHNLMHGKNGGRSGRMRPVRCGTME